MVLALKFTTLEAIREYLAGDRIQCLVCGRLFKRLQFKHLAQHGLDADGYRERFGIPWMWSLTSAPSRQASRDKLNEAFIAHSHESYEGGRKGPHRTPCPALSSHWAVAAELGRDVSARRRVTVPCSGGCGVELETTALTAAQPIFCDACASPWALRERKSYARKKAA
jgi:hypothetical protein